MDIKELLIVLRDYDITETSAILAQQEMDRRYLNQHTQKVWQGVNGRFCTHLYVKGKRRLISKGTKEELENYIILHYKSESEVVLVSEVFSEWICKKLEYGEIGRNSYDKYKATYTRYFNAIKDLDIRAITESQLEDFIKSTISGNKLTAKGWSDVRIIIRGIWKYAKRKGFTSIRVETFLEDIELSPRIFTKKTVKDEEQVFTTEEVKKITDYIYHGKMLQADIGILIAAQTGMRAGEIVALNYSDMQGNVLNVSKTEIRYIDEGNYVYTTKNATKGRNGRRNVYLTEDTIACIERLRALNGETLFTCTSRALTDRLYRICDALKIPRRSLHKLRKTYATNLIGAGISDSVVAKTLGHTDVLTTYRHYVYDNTPEEAEKAEVLEVVKEWLNG